MRKHFIIYFLLGFSGFAQARPLSLSAEMGTHLHFAVRNCDWKTAEFSGSAGSAAEIAAASANTAASNATVQVQVRSNRGAVLHTATITNPMVAANPYTSHAIRRCRFEFSVDVPTRVLSPDISLVILVTENPAQSVTLSNLDWQKKPKAQEILPPGRTLPHRLVRLHGKAPSEQAWDLVILGDGFDSQELSLRSDAAVLDSYFGQKAQELVKTLFLHEPFRSMQKQINVWLVATPSPESGISVPSKGIYKKTFYDSGAESYCISRLPVYRNALRVLEMASLAPYDQAVLLLNSNEQGGSGGVVPVATTGLDSFYAQIVIHELGHSVAHLGDGYAMSQDEDASKNCQDTQAGEEIVSDFQQERWDVEDAALPQNITRFVEPQQAKWATFLNADSPFVTIRRPQKAILNSKHKLELQYNLPEARQELLFFAGQTQFIHSSFNHFKRVWVNGNLVTDSRLEPLPAETSSVIMGSRFFIVLPLAVPAGPLSLTLEYEELGTADYLAQLVQSGFHPSFDLVSRRFSLTEVGLFQGAYPHLANVFRSSYGSLMTMWDSTFDRVEQAALKRALEKTMKSSQP